MSRWVESIATLTRRRVPVTVSREGVVVTTRSMDDELYALASALFPNLPARRLVGRTAEGYLEEVLAIPDAAWVINIDEDAFVVDMTALYDLLDLMDRDGFDYCGVSDGGVIPHRNNSPLVVNPFFNIFRVECIRGRLAERPEKPIPLEELDTIVIGRKVHIDELAYVEPFDPLLTWLSQTFRPLYLPARAHEDGITTVVSTPEGRDFILHTWYTRMFRIDLDQRRRIQARIRQAYVMAGKEPPRWRRWTDGTDLSIRVHPWWVRSRQTARKVVNAVQGTARSTSGTR